MQIFGSARAGSALRQAPRAPEAITQGDSPPRPIGPCQKSPLAKLLEGQTTQGVEKSMLQKWKPPKIINGRDDDSLEAVIRFKNQINKPA